MAYVYATKNGTQQYPVIADSIKFSFQNDTNGSDLNFTLSSVFGGVKTEVDDFFSLSLGGIDFSGRLAAIEHKSDGGEIEYNLTIAGPQERLMREIFPEVRHDRINAGTLATELLQNTGLTASFIGTTRQIYGFGFQGTVQDALNQLASAGNYSLFVHPNGTVYFFDRENPPHAPFDLILDSPDSQCRLTSKKFTNQRPVTEVIIEGGVPKKNPDDPDEKVVPNQAKGDGVETRFFYSKLADEISDVKVDGVDFELVDIDDAVVDPPPPTPLVHHKWEGFFKFAEPPGDGLVIEWKETLRKTRGAKRDAAREALLASRVPGHDGKYQYREEHPELHDQFECTSLAYSLLQSHKEVPVEVAGEYWGNSPPAYPGYVLRVYDYRDGFDRYLEIISNSPKWDSGRGHYIQTLTLGNPRPGGVPAGGNSGQSPQPPREGSGAGTIKIFVDNDGFNVVPHVGHYYSDGVYYTPDQVEAYRFWDLEWETVTAVAGQSITLRFRIVGDYEGAVAVYVLEDETQDDTTVTPSPYYGFVGEEFDLDFTKDPESANDDLFAQIGFHDGEQWYYVGITSDGGIKNDGGGGGGSGGT